MNKSLFNSFNSGCFKAFYAAVLLLFLCIAGAQASARPATTSGDRLNTAIRRSLTALTVTIIRRDPNPIHDNVLDFQAVFSDAVSNVTDDDFVMTNSGVTTGAISVTNTGDDKTYNITVASVSGSGTARLDLNGGTDIVDAGSNTPAGFTGGEVYTVDQTAPTVTSINIVGTSPTNASSVDYTVTFSEAVTGVDATDFTVPNPPPASRTAA